MSCPKGIRSNGHGPDRLTTPYVAGTLVGLMDSFYNDVNDWLSVGGDLELAAHLTGLRHTEVVEQLRQHGVTHVIDAQDLWRADELWALGESHCYAPIEDSRSHTPPEEWYVTIENFVTDFWDNSFHGDRLYVHCQMGINRGPSVAMLALLTVDPEMHPFDAFLRVREARPVAGVVYAKHIGERHIATRGGTPGSFIRMIEDYWSPAVRGEQQEAKEDAFRQLWDEWDLTASEG